MDFPKDSKNPHVSRVDGNHRLWGVDETLSKQPADDEEDENGGDFPIVSYSLLIGLDPAQEARLFRDINGEHKGMDVTHLDSIMVRITPSEVLAGNLKTLPLWLADKMSEQGRAFEGMVFRGGTREGLKRIGEQRPVKLNSLKTTLSQQLKAAEKTYALLSDDPDTLLNILDNYWKAVRQTFDEAWHDRKNFILLQAIGLGGFAKFGGSILDSVFDEEGGDVADFVKYLQPVRDAVSLRRDDWTGIAGAGGAQVVADKLLKASAPDAVKAARIKEKLSKSQSIDQRLGLDGQAGADSNA